MPIRSAVVALVCATTPAGLHTIQATIAAGVMNRSMAGLPRTGGRLQNRIGVEVSGLYCDRAPNGLRMSGARNEPSIVPAGNPIVRCRDQSRASVRPDSQRKGRSGERVLRAA